MNNTRIYLINNKLNKIKTIFDGRSKDFIKEYDTDHLIDLSMLLGKLMRINDEIKQIYSIIFDWEKDTMSLVLAPKGIHPNSNSGKKISKFVEHL
ncbi:hypothetical protein [Rummeliibacillus stabekisii]|uniref:Uncharacterized protein n=1 Tax=Rummeliibacillus stabekisii TaxID=241244 RepID=A0A143HAG4_9BACL|nr:hypothetical protein [Rummeliibacillus stabekisii]AMW98439.1 hypothetical protein ATY39_02720 [Rummeliibacillus stabekisii]AMW99217.1 hypothetical protein ATY39_06910 [Rummeliibacillus stabekisii]